MSNKHQICTRCVMDTSAKNISFNKNGECNFCTTFNNKLKTYQPDSKEKLNQSLNNLVAEIKQAGINKKYDCIVGVSGGADSSYALYLAKKQGLRPLAVHMDNGWNSELAVNNINNLVNKLEIDLFTYVIDWEEYKKLMQAFFDADVIDVELLYDNAMLAVVYSQAKKYGIKYILSGTNTSTEGIPIPKNWNWFKWDKKNIYSIAKRSNISIKSLPTVGTFSFGYFWLRKFKWVNFLDYIEYNKPYCMNYLVENYGYKPYPYKHYESVFTRFYQGHLLPNKFGVDKRKVHFSTLIMSKQMTRDDALNDLNSIPYPNQHELDNDIEYFLKKMNWTTTDLEEYINRPEISHETYGTEQHLWNNIVKSYSKLKSFFRLKK